CFVFQAEDGIRDRNVTGVQTCALPILHGDLVPTECEGMTAAANTISPARPGAAVSPSPVRPGRRRRRRPDPFRILAFVILAALALAWLVPVGWAILTSLKTEAEEIGRASCRGRV